MASRLSFPRRLGYAAPALLLTLAYLVLVPVSPVADAEGTPSISLTKTMPTQAVAGDPAIPVSLTVSNLAGLDGFNLTVTDVLPSGVSLATADPAPTAILAGEPSGGQTTLVWENIADIPAGRSRSISYTIAAGAALGVGTTIINRASAYVSSDAAAVPTYDATTHSVVNWTGRHVNVGATTKLVPFLVSKTRPGGEGGQLRGLHDQQTTYTIEVRNNYLNPTTDIALQDWLPAAVEFLGCGGVDNSTGGDEYPGAGPINPGNEPAFTNPCVVPDSVETLATNPPGPLPFGVYTHLSWTAATLSTTVGAGGTARWDYAAAIPMRENTTAWDAGEPPSDGSQTANLDNNNGASTAETDPETLVTSYAVATAVYTGTGGAYAYPATLTTSVEDLSIRKDVDSPAITQGAASLWTLAVATSEYVGSATSLTVTDFLPDGLCPLGAGSPDAECQAAGAPSQPFDSAVENADGSWTLQWNLVAMGGSGTTVITFPTRTRSHHQEDFADATPVVAGDSWTNRVTVSGQVDGVSVADDSAASQTAAGVTVGKEVAVRSGSIVDCGDGTTLSWQAASAAGYHIGDRVCWRLAIDFPTGLSTLAAVLSDYLPPGHRYTAEDTWDYGANNTVPPGDIVPDTAATAAGVIRWDIGDVGDIVAPGQHLELVLSTTVTDPLATASGDSVENVARLAYTDSGGDPGYSRDGATVEVVEPELDLVKGIAAIDGVPTGGSDVDAVAVMESTVVGYQVTVSNTGDLSADGVEVWDQLPGAFATCSSNVSAISNGGSCDDVNNRVVWEGAAALAVAAGATEVLTYAVTVPPGIAPRETMTNQAGVRTFTAATNNGSGVFTFIPSDNIDPATGPENTAAASDTSSVLTAAPTIDLAHTTSVDEAGNSVTGEATIGEEITYTATVVIPEGTTVSGGAALTDDLPANLDLISSALSFTGSPAPTLTEDGTDDIVTATFIDPYRNPPGSGDDTLEVTIVARVVDVPLNSRGTSITSEAGFWWRNQDGVAQTPIAASVAITVVEPLLSMTKVEDDADNVVVGNDVVVYTLAVGNSGSAGVSTAHDLVLVDTVPEGITPTFPIADGGVWSADPTPGDGIGGTITWSPASLAPGAIIHRSYEVTVDEPVVVSSAFTNTAVVTGTSQAGSPVGERIAGTGYAATASVTLDTPIVTVAKSVDPTAATIGDRVVYTLQVTVPAGTITYDATVIDTLPAGMAYDGTTGSTCVMGGGACTPDITAVDIGVSGTTAAAFFLGDLVPASATGEPRTVTIIYQAHLLDSGSAGNTRINTASVYGNQTDRIAGTPPSPPAPASFDVAASAATAAITIVEPRLLIDKDVGGQVGDADYRRAVPGDILAYTVSAANAGSSPAYDMTVVDVVPENVAVSTPVADGGVWQQDVTPGDGVGGTITWTIAGPLVAGDAVSLGYSATIATPLDSEDEDAGGPELVNTADITAYFGASASDRAAHPMFEFREYDDVTADGVAVELDLASIGDRVWFDVDGDGSQDAGEPGLDGVDVTVTFLGADGVAGGGDDEVYAATTGADGSYLVEQLPGGAYLVAVDTADVPAGLVASWDRDDGTLAPDDNWAGPLAEDQDRTGVDFGYTGSGTIGDTVWFDRNGDGARDLDEYGLEGVNVDALWFGFDGVEGGGDDINYPAVTDDAGGYLLSRLPGGAYRVAVQPGTIPLGMTPTYDADGVGSAGSSNVALGSGGSELGQDFGYRGAGSIGDFVWLDRNGDTAQDPAEPGIAGAQLELTWPGEDGVLGGDDDEAFLATTDGTGGYDFAGLPPGEYRVAVLGGLPAAADATFDEDGGYDSTAVIPLGLDEVHRDADFGYLGTAAVGDTVWWDQNGNGLVDAGEPGLGGVEVSLTFEGLDGSVGGEDDITFTTVTDHDGAYLFTDLPAGNYVVAVTGGVPEGMVATHDESGAADETSVVSGLTVGEIHLTGDFGYTGSGSLGDFVWLDLDADGVQDAIEPGLPGIDVALIWYGVDGVGGTGDDVAMATASDIDGNYGFVDLPAGEYRVTVDPGTLPPGVGPTFDRDGVATPDRVELSLSAGAGDAAVDFGYNGGSAIGDAVWFDRDGDGEFEAVEGGLGGVEVAVVWAGADGTFGGPDDETFPATTDGDGAYLVTQLPPGEYAIVVDPTTLPLGVTPTWDEDGSLDGQTMLTLGDGVSHLTADFGYRGTGSIGDQVWLDLDGDGSRTISEPGLPGERVEVRWYGPDATPLSSDDQLFATITDPTGGYAFTGLPPGAYEVRVPGGIAAVAANTFDADGDLDSATEVTLAVGAADDTADFGYRGTAALGDRVWLDLDADGAQDAIEPGLAGVDLTVTWYGPDEAAGGGDNVQLPSVATGPDGDYLVAGLPSGTYRVAVVSGVPTGLANSFDADGDCDGFTEVAALTPGESRTTIDFGYTGMATIGDLIWWDSDGDGAPGIEPGLRGVPVSLAWAGLDATFETGDDAEFDTATDSAGHYTFAHLAPGAYRLRIDEAAVPPGMTRSFDPDGVPDGVTDLYMAAGAHDVDQDFGYRGAGTVAGRAWYDLNTDGAVTADEPGVGAVTVTVTYLGPDGEAGGGDDVSFALATGSTGHYAQPGLPSGFYRAAIDAASLASGVVPGPDRDGGDPTVTYFTLGGAEIRSDIDFPAVGTAQACGLVWEDGDGDGLPDSNESGRDGIGVVVRWDGPDGTVAMPVVSDAAGGWGISSLPPGEYHVQLDMASVPGGEVVTTPIDWVATLVSSGTERFDFGLARYASLGNSVWIDADGDGVVDPGEEGIGGVYVNLFAPSGELAAIAITDGTGSYRFDSLVPGTYSVELDPDSVPTGLLATFDRDGSPDLATIVVLSSGSIVPDANFGFQQGLPVTGFATTRLVGWGLLLLMVGAGFVTLSRFVGRRTAAPAAVNGAGERRPPPQPIRP
jgi:fimbrial isopeptide formation D2 family protein/uncharacterized repeat protein (TIGR01451 family)